MYNLRAFILGASENLQSPDTSPMVLRLSIHNACAWSAFVFPPLTLSDRNIQSMHARMQAWQSKK